MLMSLLMLTCLVFFFFCFISDKTNMSVLKLIHINAKNRITTLIILIYLSRKKLFALPFNIHFFYTFHEHDEPHE